MPRRRFLAIAIAACAIAACAVMLVTTGPGDWRKLWSMLAPKARPTPPAPYHFKSLQGAGDDAIAGFMTSTPAPDSSHPAAAPDSNFPNILWDMDPQAAALAFANANRTPEHRKAFLLSFDSAAAIHPPDAGWLVYDSGSAICYSNKQSLTVLRFGVDQPFLFHAGSQINGVVGYNPFADRAGYALQLIPLSAAEARFLAHTLFWLEHLRTQPSLKNYATSHISSSADGFGMLDWWIDLQPPRHVWATRWATRALASRWRDKYEEETGLNLADHLVTEALPEHLGKRWDTGQSLTGRGGNLTLAERMKPRTDSVAREQLTRVILAALARHQTDPWPAAALVRLAECAGESCLPKTLGSLEDLAAKLPPPNANESELRMLETKFRRIYAAPNDPEERKSWDRYHALRDQLDDDFPTRLRPPLTRAIRQLRTLDQPAQLIEMAQSQEDDAIWALQQLQSLDPDAYTEAFTALFHDANEKDRCMIFATLAAAYPPGARRLRDGLTETDLNGLVIELTAFELIDDPARAKSRIPILLDRFQDPSGRHDRSERGPAIALLTKLPLDATQQSRFEQLLLDELKSPRRGEYKDSVLDSVYPALVNLPDPDRYWDVLVVSAATAIHRDEYDDLVDSLATLAIANPEPRLAQLAGFLRPGIAHHKGMMNHLFLAALALDLRGLAPELAQLATSGPDVPEGEDANSWGGIYSSTGTERYHTARHVTALWLEPDADTRARMWIALLLALPYDFAGHTTIASRLRDRCQAALVAVSPEIRQKLTASARSAAKIVPDLADWLTSLP